MLIHMQHAFHSCRSRQAQGTVAPLAEKFSILLLHYKALQQSVPGLWQLQDWLQLEGLNQCQWGFEGGLLGESSLQEHLASDAGADHLLLPALTAVRLRFVQICAVQRPTMLSMTLGNANMLT